MPGREMPDIDVVLQLLSCTEAYPADGHTKASRETLAIGLPHALSHGPGEEPHEIQKAFVGLVEAALVAARDTAAKAFAAAGEQAKGAEEQSDQAQVAACEAAEVLAAKCKERDDKTAAVKEIEAEVVSAEGYLRGLEEAKETVLAARALVKGKKEAADAAVQALERLSGEEEEDMQESDVACVVAYLQEVGAEEAVMAVARPALSTRPSERRPFDRTCLEEIGRIISQAAAEAGERLAEGAQGEAYAEADALGAWAILDLARERKHTAKLELAQLRRAVGLAEEAEAAAKATVEKCRLSMSGSLVEQTLMEARVKEIEAALAALARCVGAPAAESSADVAMGTEESSGGLASGEADPSSTEMKVDSAAPRDSPNPCRGGA